MNSAAGNKRNTHRRSSSTGMLLDAIFGKKVSQDTLLDDSVSEETLSKAIDFKIEQERTKQQYYKLENTNKFIDLLKLSGSLGLPINQLLMLLGDYNATGSSSSRSSSSSNAYNKNNIGQNTDQAAQNFPFVQQQQMGYRFPPVNTSLNTPPGGSKKLNTVPSLGYITSRYHRRVNSPARIGANAVASLSRNRSPAMIKEEDGFPSMVVTTTNHGNRENSKGVFSPLTQRNFSSFSPSITTNGNSTSSTTSPSTSDSRSYYNTAATEYSSPYHTDVSRTQGQSTIEFPYSTTINEHKSTQNIQSKITSVSNTQTLLPSLSHLATTNARHCGVTKPFTPRGSHRRSRSLSSPSYYSFSSTSTSATTPDRQISYHHGSSVGMSVDATATQAPVSSNTNTTRPTSLMSDPPPNVIDLDVIGRAQESMSTRDQYSTPSQSTKENGGCVTGSKRDEDS